MIMASVMKRLNATNCFLLNLGAVVQRLFCTKGVLRNFTKFTGKHQCQSLFLNKVAGLMSATLLKKRLWHRCFPVNFAKFLRTAFLYRTPLVTASVAVHSVSVAFGKRCRSDDIQPISCEL